jgi:hypothetical protein
MLHPEIACDTVAERGKARSLRPALRGVLAAAAAGGRFPGCCPGRGYRCGRGRA